MTGVGHLVSFLFYPFANTYIDTKNLASIANFDSYLILLVSILSFGVNSTAARDSATNSNFFAVIERVQSSRITLGIFIAIFALFYGLIEGFTLGVFVFSLAPIIALNYDFILYGVGKPLAAAVASFVRLSMPLFLCFIFMYFFELHLYIYILVTLIFYFASVYLVAKSSGAPIFFAPRINFWDTYFTSISIGLTGLAIALLRPGYLPMVSEILDSREIIELVYFSKFCLLAVAARRILIQYFYVWIANNLDKYYIDLILLFFGVAVLLISFEFEFILNIFNIKSDLSRFFYIYCGVAFLSVMLTGTSDAKLLLISKDFYILIIHIVPISLAILGFSVFELTRTNVLIALVAVEFCISLCSQLFFRYVRVRNE